MHYQRFIVVREAIGRQAAVAHATSVPATWQQLTEDARIEIADVDSRAGLRELVTDPSISNIAPAMPVRLIAPLAGSGIGLDPPGATWGLQVCGVLESPFDGAGVRVAVLDTGIDGKHPAFANLRIVERDFSGDGDGDGNGHGSHCAGTLVGQPVQGRRIGVAPGVDALLVGKVLDRDGAGSTDQIYAGLLWALEEGANVISLSLGLDFPGLVKQLVQEQDVPPDLATSIALQGYRANIRLFDRLGALIRARSAFADGTVVVAAAGNESRRDINPEFEIAVAPPAAAEGMISVGALASAGPPHQGLVVADFSNTGPDLCAPGVDVLSVQAGGGLVALSGTSMATPHVAGLAALWAQRMRQRSGGIDAVHLASRLVGNARVGRLAAGFDASDTGTGLARAPLD
ncbi:MAG: S8 family serine peptidase [Gammaproteobacteria bacterium]|nr:S8 family serine peptidase [Gammaproteobacteria bacterium]